MTTIHDDDQHSWTALGPTHGIHLQSRPGTDILDAVERMTRNETPAISPCVAGAATRTFVTAISCGGHLSKVGIAQLDADRQLIGLEDTLGTRHFVLDLDAEAICVLTEFARPRNHMGRRQPRVA